MNVHIVYMYTNVYMNLCRCVYIHIYERTYDLVLAWGTLYCADGGRDQLDGTYNITMSIFEYI
jgi:hypothetical protein